MLDPPLAFARVSRLTDGGVAASLESPVSVPVASRVQVVEYGDNRPLIKVGMDGDLLERMDVSPLVAFELGRLRMDQRGDARGAVRALRRVLRSKRAVLREDALARLVLLYGRLGDKRACGRSKARYVRLYPHGRYAAHLADRCR